MLTLDKIWSNSSVRIRVAIRSSHTRNAGKQCHAWATRLDVEIKGFALNTLLSGVCLGENGPADRQPATDLYRAPEQIPLRSFFKQTVRWHIESTTSFCFFLRGSLRTKKVDYIEYSSIIILNLEQQFILGVMVLSELSYF